MEKFFTSYTKEEFMILIILIIIDIFTGIAKAIKQKKFNSKIGINGLIRHSVVIFTIPIIDNILSKVLDSGLINITNYYIFMYLYSIYENYRDIGMKLPVKIGKFIKENLKK